MIGRLLNAVWSVLPDVLLALVLLSLGGLIAAMLLNAEEAANFFLIGLACAAATLGLYVLAERRLL